LSPSSLPSNKKRVTIKDVARMAGVSVTTVSNALNGRTQAMAEETLNRIQEAIRLLEYRPSRVARSLVTRRTATFGLIIAEIETPLFLQALNIIEPIAREAGHNILVCSAHNLEEERQAVNLLLEKQVDGIIFLSRSLYGDDDYLFRLPLSAPPIVMVNRTTIHERFDNIHWNNTDGVIKAMDYLVQAGHRYIALLRGPATRHSSKERLQGYKLGLQRHDLEYQEEYVCLGDYEATPEAWERITRELLDVSPRPTAILASNDTVAAVVMRTIQQAGLRVPQDITVIGNDNQPFCIYLNPTLTTVELPILEAGRRAIEILLARISNQLQESEHIMLPCPLIVRESSGPI
jgi:LacI family transcriptional regulator